MEITILYVNTVKTKHVYDWQEWVLCDCCKHWIHRKCAS